MTNFKFRTYRCEWLVRLGEVDQYDLKFSLYSEEIFATREEAQARLMEVSYIQEGSGRRIPKDAPHGYCRAEIGYREIEVGE